MESIGGNLCLDISISSFIHLSFNFLNCFRTSDLTCALVADDVHFHFRLTGQNEIIWDYCVSKEQILDSPVLQRWKECDV